MSEAARDFLDDDTKALLRVAAQPGQLQMTQYGLCLCNKLIEVVPHTRKGFSGLWADGKQIRPGVNYTALLCKDCLKTFAQHPRVVCIGCKTLMGFLPWGRQPTGFVFEKDRHYHIAACVRCNPDIVGTSILEHAHWLKGRGVAEKAQHDLVQEIEQKRLQSVREAEKLRELLKQP